MESVGWVVKDETDLETGFSTKKQPRPPSDKTIKTATCMKMPSWLRETGNGEELPLEWSKRKSKQSGA
jgi:hypothetical protein